MLLRLGEVCPEIRKIDVACDMSRRESDRRSLGLSGSVFVASEKLRRYRSASSDGSSRLGFPGSISPFVKDRDQESPESPESPLPRNLDMPDNLDGVAYWEMLWAQAVERKRRSRSRTLANGD